jgi:integrase
MSLYSRNNIYYLDLFVQGKRQRISTGIIKSTGDPLEDQKNKQRAEAIALQKKAEMSRSHANGERVHDWLVGKRRQLQRWRTILPDYFTWSDITLQYLQKLVKGMEKHGRYAVKIEPDGSKKEIYEEYSPSTIHSYLDEITSMVKKAAKRGECDYPDWDRKDIYYKSRLPKKKRVVNTNEELIKLLNTKMEFRNDILGEVWDTIPAWTFVLCTGLRFSDISQLEWCNILDTELYVKQKKTSRFIRIPINETALHILKIMRDKQPNAHDSDKIFNLPCYISTLEHLEKWRQKAGVTTKVLWHGGRRNYASILHQGNVDIYTISKLLGHSDVRVTQRYVELPDSTKIAATNSLGKILSGFILN